ncbi:hypothetical protein [Sphingopyxis sp.]|uniref:hypothetical protein n=1 Tax=Sphingopyxis sp. TaxID=1908224 RepID=UPI002ED9EDA8
MSFSTVDLTHETGRREFGLRFAQMIQHGEHLAADALLRDLLQKLPAELSALCLSLPADAVQVKGWEQLALRTAAAATQAGGVTAIGVDLTSQPVELDANGCRVPQLETNYYTDEAFAFSRSSRDKILEQCGPDGSPWQGRFADIDRTLTICGLDALNEKILRGEARAAANGRDADQADYAVILLAEWFRHLRFHQAALRGLEGYGTIGAIPLLVGTNDVGPRLEAVYYPHKAANIVLPEPSTIDADAALKAEAYARQTDKDIEMLQNTRAHLLGSQWEGDQSGYEAAEAYAKREENISFRHSPAMQEFGYCHELSEDEFELYMQAYREQREAYRTKSPLPVARPTRRLDGR